MLIKAYENQAEQLSKSPYTSTDGAIIEKLREDLLKEMRLVMQNLTKLKSAIL